MATYAIGDVQGCQRTLERLLRRLHFDPDRDRLWLVGDLVNRGPRSLETLRWARSLDDRLIVVLGNHDLHLLGRALGLRAAKRSDTIEPVLRAADSDPLLEWLRRRPLLHRQDPYLLVHAGLLPEWTVEDAESLARQGEKALRGAAVASLLGKAAESPCCGEDPAAARRVREAVSALTRLRTLSREGQDCEDFSGPPEAAPPGCVPWFDIPERRSQQATVICGHWAALGLRLQPGLIALDSGCVWGGHLSAIRLDDGEVFQEPLAD